MTAELSNFYVQYLFYRAHISVRMNMRMRQFQAIWVPDGHCASNKVTSVQSPVKWKKVSKKGKVVPVLN
jgi:hypothetical protein